MSKTIEITVPDIGTDDEVEVIEVLVSEQDQIELEQSLITVESEKASMEIPASHAGTVQSVSVKVGDKVTQGTLILVLEAEDAQAATADADSQTKPAPSTPDSADAASDKAEAAAVAPAAARRADDSPASAAPARSDAGTSDPSPVVQKGASGELASVPRDRHSPTAAYGSAEMPSRNLPHASPSVRKFARELGVDLRLVEGSGARQRITHDDVRQFVKTSLARGSSATLGAGGNGAGLDILSWPKVDFERFGEIEAQPLSRIRKISGANLHRNWVMIPHVTNHDVADITELEDWRQRLNDEYGKGVVRVTMLAFIIKAVVAALKEFPEFNASLDGDRLILKKYFHIGFAADTPNGLVVPVIRDADAKGIVDLARETAELAALAREGKLGAAQMQGGCFTISSLGGIGGTSFTPIINAPEVAILGVSRSRTEPVWDGEQFGPRLMLPLSLSYDHRVIDGAAAARFNVFLTRMLADFRRIAL